MAKNNAAIPPFHPDNLASDAAWVALLDPKDRLEYWTARKTFDHATEVYKAAIAAADAGLAKVTQDYDALKVALKDADKALQGAISHADKAKKALAAVVDELDPKKSTDAHFAAHQKTQLEKAVKAYLETIPAIAAKVAARAGALKALEKASQPQKGPFDPNVATINDDTLQMAEAQAEVAKGAAKIPYEKAWDVLLQKRAVLYSHLDDQVPTGDIRAAEPRPLPTA